MFDETDDDEPADDETGDMESHDELEPGERNRAAKRTAADRAAELIEQYRMHAELAAVFEGPRKFDSQIVPLEDEAARTLQKAFAALERARMDGSNLVELAKIPEAVRVLREAGDRGLAMNDYHVSARPGETRVARWLSGDEVGTFYKRLQAHFDAAMGAAIEEERSNNQWKQQEGSEAYLAELEKAKVIMEARYGRAVVLKTGVPLLSTQTADEINIQYLCEQVMGVSVAEVVGEASAPGLDARESDLAWYFKLFSLRGTVPGEAGPVETTCFFVFLQKTDEGGW